MISTRCLLSPVFLCLFILNVVIRGEIISVTVYEEDLSECTEVVDPVCGTDGVTYKSACELELAANATSPFAPVIQVASVGICHSICTDEFEPVCGSNKVTYANQCKFTNAALHDKSLILVSEGPCEQGDVEVGSGDEEEEHGNVCAAFGVFPVCGSDGKTYTNKCFLQLKAKKMAGLTFVKDGKCFEGNKPASQPEVAECPRDLSPVCGIDGQTYLNACELERARVQIAHQGGCMFSCSTRVAPVCGSNGVTYKNKCLLSLSVVATPDLQIVSVGECPSTSTPRPLLRKREKGLSSSSSPSSTSHSSDSETEVDLSL